MKEAAEFAETTQILMNVSEFTDVSQATDALISSVQAFGYTAETSMNVVDLLNTIGNNYAISTADLAQSLTKSSASLVAAGGDLAEAAALTATANKIIQDADSVGTALKTTSLRLRGTDVSVLEEEGVDSEGAVTSKSKLQGKVKALSGVDILTETGEYKSTYQILSEIADVWESINDMDQAALLELISGKRNSSVVAAILQNPKELKDAFEDANNASGSALKENEKYLDSIQGRLDQFNNALQSMWNNVLDDDLVKFIVQAGTELLKIVDNVGILKTLIFGIGTFLIQKHFKGDLLGGIFNAQSIDEAKDRLKNLKAEIATLQGKEKNPLRDAQIKSKQKKASALGASIDEYDKLSEELKNYRTELTNTEKALDTVNAKIGSRIAKGKEPFKKDIEQQKKLQAQYDKTKKQITDTEAKLKQVEDQSLKTGTAGLNAGKKIATGFKSAGKSIVKFGKQMLQSMAYMYIITATAEVLGTAFNKLIEIWKDSSNSFDNLQEKFEEARGEVESLQSEIKNLETELEATDEQIEDLLALDTLTFVEQEELERLKSVSEELRAQVELKQQLQGSLQKGANDATIVAADKYMDTSFANEKTKTEVEEEGGETGNFWGTVAGIGLVVAGLALAPFTAGASTSATGWGISLIGAGLAAPVIGEALGSGFAGSGYDAEESVSEAIANMNIQRDELIKARDEALAAYADGSGSKEAYESAEQELTEYNANLAKSITQISEYRNAIMSDVENATPEQLEWAKEQGDIIDAYNIAMGGKGAKEAAINRVFSDGKALGDFEKEKKEIDEYIEALKDGDKSAAEKIANLINNNQALKDAFSAKTLDPQDAIDYFTKLGSDANFKTIEGKTEDIRKATEKLGTAFNHIGWFMKDDKVNTSAIAEYFKGISDATRKEIARLVKNIHDGEITVAQALKSFAAYGMVESWKIIEAEVSELNTNVFSDLGDEISGVINTVKELSSAFESVASSIELVDKAQAEMAYSGHLSVETALQLMESTDDWNQVLKIEEGNIKLVDGAEQALVQTKLDLIKKNLQTALSTVEAQLAQISATEASADMAYTIEESTNLAVTQLAGNMAYLTEMMTAYTRAAAGEKVNMSAVTASAEAAKKQVLAATDYQKNAAEKIGREGLEKEKARLEAMLGIYDTVDTPKEFRSNYPSDEVSGGNADKDSAEDNLFQKEMDYWENRIGANQAKYEQLQNEIDLLEAKGQKADASFYEEQIELEKEREWLLEEQKKQALARLKAIEDAGGEGNEQWWEVANVLNDIEGELDDVTASIVDLQDAIAEIDTYKFEEFNTRLDNLTSKLETIRNLIAPDGEEDWFDSEGAWTEAGVAVLGSQLQQLEMYKQGYQETMDELDKYEPDYAGNEAYYETLGIQSEQMYYDKTEELISQQYDYAQSISDTEQSIVDMYESNIDAVEEYTETLIDSYNDYIDSVKEALDAERDLYDFKKNVQKQSKDIAAIERRIASLSGSTNKSDIAERRKLEAQLYESRESLNDTYYDHAKNAQSEALDKEAEAYETAMTQMVEGMRVSLEEATADMTSFLDSVTIAVSMNAQTVLDKYRDTEVPLNDAITNPWEEAAEKVKDYGDDAKKLMDVWKTDGYFAEFKSTAGSNLSSPWNAGTTAANSFKNSVSTVMSGVVSNISSNVRTASGELSKLYQQIQDTEKRASDANVVVSGSGSGSGSGGYVAPQKKYYVNAFLDMGGRSLSVTKSGSTSAEAMSAAKIAILGEYEKVKGNSMSAESAWQRTWRNKVKYTTQYYAKGTTGTKDNEWAITDEFGPELKMYATPDGNLSFMALGSTVVPHDLTMDLIELPEIVDGLINRPNFDSGINMISNAINKPEFNITFDSLVRAENITEETLPAVKKLVTQELNRFTKELNYALKGKGAR